MITVHVIFRDVPKLDGARENKKFGAHMFEPKSPGSKCTVLNKVLVTLLVLPAPPQ